jgi:hypothetical protein
VNDIMGTTEKATNWKIHFPWLDPILIHDCAPHYNYIHIEKVLGMEGRLCCCMVPSNASWTCPAMIVLVSFLGIFAVP